MDNSLTFSEVPENHSLHANQMNHSSRQMLSEPGLRVVLNFDYFDVVFEHD